MSKQQATKRTLTLDLQNGPAKRTRLSLATPSSNPPILTTPDVQRLNMSSPELANFINANTSLATPTPSGFAYPKSVAEEQELYTKGFQKALENLNEKDEDQNSLNHETAIATIERAMAAHNTRSASLAAASSAPNNTTVITAAVTTITQSDLMSRPSSGASGSIDSADVKIKEEYTDESDDDGLSRSSAGGTGGKLSPIDMGDQEKIKLERKRQRNRVAASRCRKRKLERIAQLEDKVQKLKNENGELAGVVKKLKESICNLKQEVMTHVQSGCQVAMTTDS